MSNYAEILTGQQTLSLSLMHITLHALSWYFKKGVINLGTSYYVCFIFTSLEDMIIGIKILSINVTSIRQDLTLL